MILPFTANALSATTVNTIQGTKPALSFDGGSSVAENLDKLLSFTMPNGSGGEVTIEMTQTDEIEVDPNFTFDQFKTIVTADGQAKTMLPSYYYDADGDVPDATTPVSGTLTATWSYVMPDGATVKTLSQSDLAEEFDACNAPYTLTIKANSVNVKSGYGDPLTNSYADTSKSYTFLVDDYKACYAKPNSIKVKPLQQWVDSSSSTQKWNEGNPIRNATYGGGYTNDFVPYGGFKATASTKFPTTGFVGAKFQLVMSNGQSYYSYALQSGDGVDVDPATGDITFTSKPSGAVTIRATPNVAGHAAIDYTFSIIGLWAKPTGKSAFWTISTTGPNAPTQCGGIVNTLIKTELTNAPAANSNHRYTRAINEGLFSEWGPTSTATYPDSNWLAVDAAYWTNEDYDSSKISKATINSANGKVATAGSMNNSSASAAGVVCRG